MKRVLAVSVICGLVTLLVAAGSGCTTSEEKAQSDAMTKGVGNYDPPPPGIVKVRVGVPPLSVTGESNASSEDKLGKLAADQMTTLAHKSGRFIVIERTQLDQLLKEQDMEGIVKSGELAKRAQVRGVDYLMLGKVTNIRVKSERAAKGFGIGTVVNLFGGSGLFDYKDKSQKIVTECGVDIRLTDPSSGEVFAADFGEFQRIDTIGATGITILGTGAEAEADLQVSEDDKGKILRLALDESLRKMLPEVDQKLVERAKAQKPAEAAPAAQAAPTTAPAAAQAAPAGTQPAVATPPATPQEPAAKRFCSNCGKEMAADAKFCPGCGAKTSP